jgi:hypothetical protein
MNLCRGYRNAIPTRPIGSAFATIKGIKIRLILPGLNPVLERETSGLGNGLKETKKESKKR